MARYRIGNDITIIWTVNDRNGAALPLADKDVRLFYTCERGRYQAEITIQDTNKVVWDFRGGLQKVLGGYSLTLEILQSDGKRSIKKDVCNAFLLVAKDCEADAKETTTNGELAVYQEQITTNLDIARISPIIPVIVEDENGVGYWYVDGVNTGDRATGESAYEYAKRKGYEGTEDEFAEQMAGLGQGLSVDIVNTTYEEIVNLRNDNNLIKGCPYRITDYVTTTAKEYTQSAGHPFDIIVFAISGDALSENAMCALHEGDEYFAESNIESWRIKYCLDNDTSRFDWADTENGKGVIYWMEDQNRNFAPYDFKNLLVYGETLRGRSQSALSDCPIPIDNRSLTIIGSSYYYMFSSLDGTVDRSLKGSYIQNSGFKVTGASDDVQYLSPSAILCPENYAILSFQVDYGFWSGIVLTSASDLTDDGSVAVSIKNLTNSIIVTSRMNYFTANAISNSYIDVGIQLTGMDLGVISNSAISTQYFQSCAISMLSNSYIQMTTAIDSMVIKGRGTDLVFAGDQLLQVEFSLVKGFEYIGEPSEKIGNFYSDCHFITLHSDGSRTDMKEFLLPMKSYSQRLYYKYGGTIASMYEYDYVAASSLATINGKRIDEGGNIVIEGSEGSYEKSDWNEDDGSKNSYVRNRTHYIKGSNITGAGTYRATTGHLLFDGKMFDLPADTTEITISSGPVIKAKWIATESQVIVTTGSGGDSYLKAYPIKVVEEYVPLDENFIPDSIARQQELTELSEEVALRNVGAEATDDSVEDPTTVKLFSLIGTINITEDTTSLNLSDMFPSLLGCTDVVLLMELNGGEGVRPNGRIRFNDVPTMYGVLQNFKSAAYLTCYAVVMHFATQAIDSSFRVESHTNSLSNEEYNSSKYIGRNLLAGRLGSPLLTPFYTKMVLEFTLMANDKIMIYGK